ncbi:hypothetical protein H5410_048751, partial [Solanum commersonii]
YNGIAINIDGKAIAQTIRSEIASEVQRLSEKYGKVSYDLGKCICVHTDVAEAEVISKVHEQAHHLNEYATVHI